MPPRRTQIAALLATGLSIREVAQRLDLAPATIRYHVARLNENAAPSLPPADPDLAPTRIEGTTRREVRTLLAEGLTHSEIAIRLGVGRPAVTYHAHRLGESVDERCARRYDWVAIQRFHDAGHTMRECVAQFGFSPASWSQAVQRGAITPRSTALSTAALCVEGRVTNRGHLKARLLREGLKTGCCELCGLRDWQGRAITLALHHVNGKRNDNRLENLQLLCPNCHSQTDNFAGRRRPAADPD